MELQSYLDRQQVIKIERAAQEELLTLRSFLDQNLTTSNRIEIYEAFQRARFGFEQALNISPKHDRARFGLDDTLSVMIQYKIKDEDFDAAEVLFKSMKQPSIELRKAIDDCKEKQQYVNEEKQRLRIIGERYDLRTSRRGRRNIIIIAY